MKPKFETNKQKRDEMVAQIRAYFQRERGEDIGDLACMPILDFFVDKLAPEFYNQGVYDSHKYMTAKAEDLLGIQKH